MLSRLLIVSINNLTREIISNIMYMDSSGANNITNAQIMENSIIKELWTDTPAAIGARVNLDGFPVCIFHATAVDDDGIPYRLVDGERKDPEYLGIFNFNYDKKPKALLGWEKYTDSEGNSHKFKFKGFEFRDNTSDICLQKGISGMLNFVNANVGFEYRWTYESDYIDDYHDGNLNITMDGGFFDEDLNKYDEAGYLANRFDTEIINLPPFNRIHVKDEDGQWQIMKKNNDDSYSPWNYLALAQGTDVWSQEYGLKFGEKDGVEALLWQPPYGAVWSETSGKWTGGELYSNGEGYYKFERNPEHKCYFKFNDTEDYFANNDNWNVACPLSDLYAYHYKFDENENGEYVLDPIDETYYALTNYPKFNEEGEVDESGAYIKGEDEELVEIATLTRYTKVEEYKAVQISDELVIEDFMKHVFANWYYCIDTLCHIPNTEDNYYTNYRNIIDSTKTYSDEYGDNGNGLFIYDALLNYYCSSVTVALCDNFCKNMMIHSYDDGKTWSPAWYDMDTCFGLNNTGAYVFDYDCDFKDPSTFNGSGSKLWDGLYNICMSDIQTMYRKLRGSSKTPSGQKLSYDKSMAIVYDANIKYKSEAMYNSSAFFRYIIPDLEEMSGTQLPAAQGNRLSLLHYWLSNRQTYLDSRYGSDDYTNDRIIMRMSAPKTVNFELTPDTAMYLGFSFNQSDASMPADRSGKIKEGQTWSFTYTGSSYPLNDLNTYIYGASHLIDVGDLSGCTPKTIDISSATKLKRLILGTDDKDVLARHDEVSSIQGMAITMPKEPCRNMTEIDLHNLKYLSFGGSTTLSLTSKEGTTITNLYPALEKLDIRGSNINQVNIGEYTPLSYIGYSDSITTVELTNLPQLTTVEFGSLDQVATIAIQNCAALNQLELLQLFTSKNINISADNLQCGEDEALPINFMDWLYSIDADLTGGSIYVQSMADSELDKYRIKWPNLTINLYQIYSDDVIFGVTGEGV